MTPVASRAWATAASCYRPGSTVATCRWPGNSCCGLMKASSFGCDEPWNRPRGSNVSVRQDRDQENAMQRQDQLDEAERKRIQEKQGGHHYPPRPEDGPPMDDTDRNTDKVIKPSRRKP